jgi:hypothetical protein
MKKTSNNIIHQETKPEFIQEFASDVGQASAILESFFLQSTFMIKMAHTSLSKYLDFLNTI